MHTAAKTFRSASEVADYYDQRFEADYMNGWDDHVATKVQAFFKQLADKSGLPLGTYLDFGCGQGALTSVLESVHPTGDVAGCDVSSVALQKAAAHNSEIAFTLWQSSQMKKSYDLIFSHHVLEHVLNLEETLDELIDMSTQTGLHCHILPCGNPGSLEWKVANATRDGFEAEGRFFFEEDGHLRRLTSDQLVSLYEARGYRLVFSQFTNQHYGAFKWIHELGPAFICKFANPKRGKSWAIATWLYALRLRLLLLCQSRCLINNRPTSRVKSFLYPFVLPMAKSYLNHFYRLLSKEAAKRIGESNGSEMLLCFCKR